MIGTALISSPQLAVISISILRNRSMLSLLLPAALARVHAVDVAGVAPFDQHLYQPDSDNTFGCLSDPSIRIPFSQVNDDYCDCPDGSDEPGTSACSNGRFWCAGSEQYIPSRVVGDGVCDYEVCCDGSDEAPGLCPDKCAEVKARQEERRQAELRFLEEGVRLRNEMVEQATARKNELAESVKLLGSQIKGTEAEILRQRENLKNAAESESKANLDPESVATIIELRRSLHETEEHLDVTFERFIQLKDAYNVLDEALSRMSVDYNPNFNDPAVKDAIKKWKAHNAPELSVPATRNIEADIELLDKIKIAKSGDDDASNVRHSDSTWRNVLNGILPPIISKHIPGSDGRIHGASGGPKTQKIQEQITELENTLSDLQQKLKLDTKLLSVDSSFWGPEEIGRSAENLCVAIQRGDFNYEVCLYGTAVQIDGVHKVQLGHSTGLKNENTIEFVGGNRCPNGVDRSLTLNLECGHTTEAYSVEEPEVCHYVVKAKSPIVCYAQNTSDKPVHDEL